MSVVDEFDKVRASIIVFHGDKADVALSLKKKQKKISKTLDDITFQAEAGKKHPLYFFSWFNMHNWKSLLCY